MNLQESETVKSEVIALQAVLMAVFRRLAVDVPELGPVLCQAFDEAESILTGVTLISVPPEAASAVSALRVVEELRAAVLGATQVCSDG